MVRPIEKKSNELRICSWNINGLSSKKQNKLIDSVFLNELKDFDIIALQETHMKQNPLLTLDSYDIMQTNGFATKNKVKVFGGLACLVKKSIRCGVKYISSPDKSYMWLKLIKSFFGLEKDLYICNIYIPPKNSNFLKDGDSMLEDIEKDIQQFSAMGNILMCGDFNARVSNECDYIEFDSSKHLPLDDQYKPDTVLPKRFCQDNECDARGKQLLSLCIASGIRILNGRFIGDSLGYYTCHRPNGSSVVDYMLTDEQFIDNVLYFHVHPLMGSLSDHCKLSIMIRATFKHVVDTCFKGIPLPAKYIWDHTSGNIFKDILADENIVRELELFQQCNDNSETGVNNAVCHLNNIVSMAADRSLKKSNKTKRKNKNKNKKWFDADLIKMRRKVDQKGNLLSKFPSDPSIRNSFYKTLKDYNRARKFKYKQYKLQLLEKLDNLKETDPKAFWNIINQMNEDNHKDLAGQISHYSWHDYFLNLNKKECELPDENVFIAEIETLKTDTGHSKHFNEEINTDEISKAIRNLKSNKAVGPDSVSNEMLKSGQQALLPSLKFLFNMILKTGKYPKAWCLAFISPIYKAGNPALPSNYRGLAILSCIGKLFNSVLNARLDEYFLNNNIINKTQIGFKKGCRTSDHILTLKTIINKYLANTNNPTLFTCFVDFHKAFDTISHVGLKYKLLKAGINGTFLETLSDMYSKSNMAVKVKGSLTASFSSMVGVRQGDVLSPNLFNLFMNDLPLSLNKEEYDLINLHNEIIPCLLYADDLVLLSRTAHGLQNQLDHLSSFCTQWGLKVNLNKTKIICFNKKGKLVDHKLKYSDVKIENVTSYKYLGIDIHCSGSFNLAIQNLYEKGIKAMFKLTKTVCNYKPSTSTLFHLFDMMIKPILIYSSEIWGVPKITKKQKSSETLLKSYEKLQSEVCHQKFCRYTLGVHKKTTLDAIYGETGRYPLSINIITNILTYWNRICTHVSQPNSLLSTVLYQNISLANDGKQSWALSVFYILDCLGLDKFKNPDTTSQEQIPVQDVLRKLKHQYNSTWSSNLKSGRGKGIEHSKLRTYALFKPEHCKETYLDVVKNVQYRTSLTKFRTSSHKLNIEIGRYQGLPIDQRICKLCNNNKVEDELHLFSECPAYLCFRTPVFNALSSSCRQFSNLSCKDKFIWAMTNPEPKICLLIAKFVHDCFTYRDSNITTQ